MKQDGPWAQHSSIVYKVPRLDSAFRGCERSDSRLDIPAHDVHDILDSKLKSQVEWMYANTEAFTGREYIPIKRQANTL